MRRVVVPLTLTALVALRLAAQVPDVAARLTGRVSPEVARAVAGIAASAAERGLPVEPLVQKAIVKQVRQLARASHPPYDAALTLRVAATLAALGVPPTSTVDLLQGVISAGRPPSEVLDLPGEVQAGVAQGATPAQAAQGLGRAAANAPPGRPPGWVPPGQQKPPNPHKP